MLPIAIAIAASPPPIIVAVLMLVSARPRANGLAYALGWVAGIAALGTLVLVIAETADASDDGDPATWASLLNLAFGVVLLALAARQWSGRPRAGDEVPIPAWMGAISAFTPVKAAGAGFGLSVANPKNVLFVIAAAATEAQADLSAGQEALAWAVFVCLASLGVAVPLLLYFALGDALRRCSTAQRLARLQQGDGDGGALPGHRRDADRRRHRGAVGVSRTAPSPPHLLSSGCTHLPRQGCVHVSRLG